MTDRRVCCVLCLVLCASVLAGCWTFRAGDAARTASPAVTSLPAEAWPARDMEAIARLRDATPSQILVGRVYEVQGFKFTQPGDGQQQAVGSVLFFPTLPLAYNAVHGQGLLRLVDVPGEGELSRWVREFAREQREMCGFVPSGWFVTSRVLKDPRVQIELERIGAMREGLQRVRSLNPYDAKTIEALLAPDESLVRTGLAVKLPAVSAVAPRGLVMHLHSLMVNRYEPAVMEEFRRNGWAVVTLFTSTGVSPEYARADREVLEAASGRIVDCIHAEFDALCAQIDTSRSLPAQRATAFARRVQAKTRLTMTRDLRRVLNRASYQVCGEDDVEPAGRRIAHAVDEALASNAYAVEGVLEYIRLHRPDIDPGTNGTPLVIIGFSAGAFATPAAVARVREQVSCAVLVGGGADLFRVAQHSTLSDGGLRVRCGAGPADRALRGAVGEAYLRETRLDPYHTAPLLRDLPVLQVHALWDAIVPASCGALLHERLGRPDLLTLAGGHTALFMLMPGQARRIVEWVERHAPVRVNQASQVEKSADRACDLSVKQVKCIAPEAPRLLHADLR